MGSAIQGLPASGVCSEAQLTAINAAIGRLVAFVPESMTMDVYNSVGALVDPKVPAYLMSTVKEADAKAAYEALVEFTKVVKANPIAAPRLHQQSRVPPSTRQPASFRLQLTPSSRMWTGPRTCSRSPSPASLPRK